MMHRSPLGRARGLGAAGHGAQDWWRQRVSAVALVPLTLWLAAAVAALPGLEYPALLEWLKSPWNSILLLSFILATAYHTVLGLQVVIEDYIHADWLKLAALLTTKLAFGFLALAAVIATLRILFQD